VCDHCKYAANVEKAVSIGSTEGLEDNLDHLVDLPESLKESLSQKLSPELLKKSSISLFDCSRGDVSNLVLTLVPRNRNTNELLLKSFLSADSVAPVEFSQFKSIEDISIVLDSSLDSHGSELSSSILSARDGDTCKSCMSGKLKQIHGIEVGHVFYLGKKYSVPLNANFSDDKGKPQPIVMGCYGLGITRILAAAVEVSHDHRGIIWPRAIAPHKVAIVTNENEENDPKTQALIQKLCSLSVMSEGDVVLIDQASSKTSFGQKLRIASLLGFPVTIIAGKKFTSEKLYEMEIRSTGDKTLLRDSEVLTAVEHFFNQ
jgi:prolyl-tRNA synthetase